MTYARRYGRHLRIVAAGMLVLAWVVVPAPASSAATSIGTYEDRFSSTSYSNSDGSLPWSSSWVELGDDNSPASGAFKIGGEVNCPGTVCLVAGRDGTGGSSIQRSVDLSAADSAILEYEYQRHLHGSGAGRLRISIKTAAQGGWTQLAEYLLDTEDATPTTVQHDVAAFLSSDTLIKLELMGSTDETHINFDYLKFELFQAENQAPWLDPILDQTIPEEVPFSFTATATDPNPSNTLTFSLDGSEPAGATMTGDGAFSWTPTEAQGPGQYTFDVIVVDDGMPQMSDSQTVTLTVAEVNRAPSLNPIGDRSVGEGSTLAFSVTATDAETATNDLVYELYDAPPAGAVMSRAGDFSWTPAEFQGPGSYTFGVKVWDDGQPARYDSELITITVSEKNRPPSISPIEDQAVDEGSKLEYQILVSDPDLPANLLGYSLSGEPAGATISSSGLFNWTPSDSQGPGTYTFDVRVQDDGSPAMADTAQMTVVVDEANIAPSVDAIGDRTVAEGSTLTFTASATDPDSPPNAFTFSLSGQPFGATINPDGDFSWTPGEIDGPGVYSFEVIATDDGVPPMSGSTTVTVNVLELNSAPSLAPFDAMVIDEGALLSIQAQASDPDVPRNSLNFRLEGAPDGATINSAGVISWTPSEDQGPGEFFFDVVVEDDGAPVKSARQSISIVVLDANNAPVIDPIGPKQAIEGAMLSFTVTAIDPDEPSDTFWFSLSGAVPSGAAVTSGGLFTWTPTETQGPGTYEFEVVVTDTGSPNRSSTQPMVVTVEEANQAPVLYTPSTRVLEAGVASTVPLVAFDPDLPAQALMFTASGLPAGAEIKGTELLWTPPVDAAGVSYTIELTVTDDGVPGLSDSAVITLNVVSANLAPVLDAIGHQTATVGELLTFEATAHDPDGPDEDLRFALSGESPAGAAIDSRSGVFRWRPFATQDNREFIFSIVVTDGGEVPKSDTEAVTVTVGTPNRPPTIVAPEDQRSLPGTDITVAVVATDPDEGPEAMKYTAEGLPPGLQIDGVSGVIAGTVGFDGLEGSPHIVTLTIDDGEHAASTSFTWEVVGVADPPQSTPSRSAVVGGVSSVRNSATPDSGDAAIDRTFVIMARALRIGAERASVPLLALFALVALVATLGRIGLVPIMRRGTTHQGMILSYDPTTGIGLVAREADGSEVFVHSSAVSRRDRRSLVMGDPVKFRTVDGAYRDMVTRLRRRQ